MDEEQRKAFATLFGQMSTIASDVSAGTVLQRETIAEVKYLSGSVDQLSGRVQRLEHHVFGSNPPPAPVPVVKRITHTEGDLAELAGQVIAVKADVAAVKEINEEQTRMLLANTTDTIAIRREVVDGLKGFWKRHPKLENALVALIFTIIGVATAWVAARGGHV